MIDLDDIKWCRDERCPIITLHPAHRIRKQIGPGRRPGAIKGTRQPKKSRAGWRTELFDGTCPECRGCGWLLNNCNTCLVCLGQGRLNPMALHRYKEERQQNGNKSSK